MVIAFLFWLALPHATFADNMIRAQVAAAADIYAQPDFGAKVIERVAPGTVLLISTGKTMGASGMGLFFKVRTPSGKTGFITDSDMNAPSVGALKPIPSPQVPQTKKKMTGERPSFGPLVALIDYAEKIDGTRHHSAQMFFGMRRTGGGRRPDSLRSDISLMISPMPPTFLSSLGAYGPAKGYLAIADVLAVWPFLANRLNSLNLQIGPMLAYSKYSANLETGPYTANKFRAGGEAGLGYAYNFSSGVLRIDLKYFLESAIYPGALSSFQFNF